MNWRGFGTGHGLMKVLSWHLPGGTEDSHRKHKKGNDLVEIQCRHNLIDGFKKGLTSGTRCWTQLHVFLKMILTVEVLAPDTEFWSQKTKVPGEKLSVSTISFTTNVT